jgi:hypothetical protein
MEIEQSRIDDLVSRPSESLNVEIKSWIDPDEPEGIAKIVKAAFAIRNRNGGFLLVGFEDKTWMPDTGAPADVRATFTLDRIQGIISRYASEMFEVKVGFGSRNGQEHPCIIIPEGVRTPVAAKRDLKDVTQSKVLIREGEVYFRTLASNGTPSTSAARSSDWTDIVEICFENREADVGRFLRRHLAGKEIASFVEALTGLKAMTPPPNLGDRAQALLSDGEHRFETAIAARTLDSEETLAIGRGAWSVALVIDPPHTTAIPDASFLSTAMAGNPNYTGWPVWLDSRTFRDPLDHPRVVENAWEALIISREFQHIDFMRLDAKGEFYHWRVLQDDHTERTIPGASLDVVLVLIGVAEAIAVGLSIAKSLGWEYGARLGFAFRWTKLHGRELASWAKPEVTIRGRHTAHTETVDTFVEVPLDTPISAIGPYVEVATRDLFVIFDGYSVPSQAIEHWAQRLIERRL